MTERERVEQLRVFLHNSYNGGHHDEVPRNAFHHGMDTVCNQLGNGKWLEIVVAERVREELEAAARDVCPACADNFHHSDKSCWAAPIRKRLSELEAVREAPGKLEAGK